MEPQQKPRRKQISVVLIIIIILTSLFLGVFASFFLIYVPLSIEIHDLQMQVTTLNQQIENLQTSISYFTQGWNLSLPELFDQIRQSVVVVDGLIQHRDFFGRI